MRYVIDSNVALKWVKDEPHSDRARRLRDAYHDGLRELLAPDFFIAECGYALFKMEHQGKIVQADQLHATLLLAQLDNRPTASSSASHDLDVLLCLRTVSRLA